MSASDQPMEMKARVEFDIDKKAGVKAGFETTFVIEDPVDAVERGAQMQKAMTAFIAGMGVEANG